MRFALVVFNERIYIIFEKNTVIIQRIFSIFASISVSKLRSTNFLVSLSMMEAIACLNRYICFPLLTKQLLLLVVKKRTKSYSIALEGGENGQTLL